MLEIGAFSLSPYGIAVACAAVMAIILFRLRAKEFKHDTVTIALFVIPFAFVGARIIYCLSRFEYVFFEIGALSILRTWEGGFMLWGAMLGGILGAYVYAKVYHADLKALLDAMVSPALLAIVVCRAAEYFTTEGRGLLIETEGFCRFPIAIMNEYEEWQLAVFIYEALAALALLCLVGRNKAKGERFLDALLGYSVCQAIFESLRMDETPRFGFVRVSQVFAGIAIMTVILIRAWNAGGKSMTIKHGVIALLCCAAVGIMEWALDKTTIPVPICYLISMSAMVIVFVVGMQKPALKSITQTA